MGALRCDNQATSIAQATRAALRRGDDRLRAQAVVRPAPEQLGVKFRRQHPLGPYIADFACLAAEADRGAGWFAACGAGGSTTRAATRSSAAQGFEVLRFCDQRTIDQHATVC